MATQKRGKYIRKTVEKRGFINYYGKGGRMVLHESLEMMEELAEGTQDEHPFCVRVQSEIEHLVAHGRSRPK